MDMTSVNWLEQRRMQPNSGLCTNSVPAYFLYPDVSGDLVIVQKGKVHLLRRHKHASLSMFIHNTQTRC
jgi:hypothetical protein